MWFIWLGLGLGLVAAGGLFVRNRLDRAALVLGVGVGPRRAMRAVALWLLFAYPVIVFSTVGISIALGSDRMAGTEHPLATWGLVYPFFWTVLVVVQALPWLGGIELVRLVRRVPGMTRGHAIAVVAVIGAFGVYTPARILWEHGDLRWRTYTVQARGAGAGGAAIPPFRIAFVADFQQDAYTTAAEVGAIIDRLGASKPDVFLSGGDWINMGPDHIEAAAATAARAQSRLGTFSVRGDHEHFVYSDRGRSVAAVTEAMQRAGVAMLHNEVRRFDHHGRTIAVAFLTFSYPARTPRAEIERLIAATQGADLTILVTHQLDEETAALARDRIDLVLAAHTHGGQVNPVLGLWHAPLARLETPYVDGRYQLGRTTIIVTAGVGFSIVPFRYASPGSVETIDVVW